MRIVTKMNNEVWREAIESACFRGNGSNLNVLLCTVKKIMHDYVDIQFSMNDDDEFYRCVEINASDNDERLRQHRAEFPDPVQLSHTEAHKRAEMAVFETAMEILRSRSG